MDELIARPHPALTHFPTGLYPSSFFFAILFYFSHNLVFLQVSYWCFLIAALMVLPVAVTGLADMVRLKRQSPEGHRYLKMHLLNGAVITALSIIWGLLFFNRPPIEHQELRTLFMIATVLMTALVAIQGYIASLMVYRHHLGIEGETR